MDTNHRNGSIQLSVSRRIRDLAARLDALGDDRWSSEALRLADAVEYLESEMGRQRAALVSNPTIPAGTDQKRAGIGARTLDAGAARDDDTPPPGLPLAA
jgi:hypothetical protein